MTDNTRADFEAFCKTKTPGYKPSDDSITTRRDWSFWQAATLAERERCIHKGASVFSQSTPNRPPSIYEAKL